MPCLPCRVMLPIFTPPPSARTSSRCYVARLLPAAEPAGPAAPTLLDPAALPPAKPTAPLSAEAAGQRRQRQRHLYRGATKAAGCRAPPRAAPVVIKHSPALTTSPAHLDLDLEYTATTCGGASLAPTASTPTSTPAPASAGWIGNNAVFPERGGHLQLCSAASAWPATAAPTPPP